MSKFDWDFPSKEELVPHIEHLAMIAIGHIIETPSFTLERKYGEIYGVVSLLHQIQQDISDFYADKAKEKIEFAESCEKAQKAMDDLFGTNDKPPVWKVTTAKTEVPDGTDT